MALSSNEKHKALRDATYVESRTLGMVLQAEVSGKCYSWGGVAAEPSLGKDLARYAAIDSASSSVATAPRPSMT